MGVEKIDEYTGDIELKLYTRADHISVARLHLEKVTSATEPQYVLQAFPRDAKASHKLKMHNSVLTSESGHTSDGSTAEVVCHFVHEPSAKQRNHSHHDQLGRDVLTMRGPRERLMRFVCKLREATKVAKSHRKGTEALAGDAEGAEAGPSARKRPRTGSSVVGRMRTVEKPKAPAAKSQPRAARPGAGGASSSTAPLAPPPPPPLPASLSARHASSALEEIAAAAAADGDGDAVAQTVAMSETLMAVKPGLGSGTRPSACRRRQLGKSRGGDDGDGRGGGEEEEEQQQRMVTREGGMPTRLTPTPPRRTRRAKPLPAARRLHAVGAATMPSSLSAAAAMVSPIVR